MKSRMKMFYVYRANVLVYTVKAYTPTGAASEAAAWKDIPIAELEAQSTIRQKQPTQ